MIYAFQVSHKILLIQTPREKKMTRANSIILVLTIESIIIMIHSHKDIVLQLFLVKLHNSLGQASANSGAGGVTTET